MLSLAKCMQIYQHKWNSITSFYLQLQWSELSKADISMHARSLYTRHTHVRVRLTEKSYKPFKYKVYVVYYKYVCCFRPKKASYEYNDAVCKYVEGVPPPISSAALRTEYQKQCLISEEAERACEVFTQALQKVFGVALHSEKDAAFTSKAIVAPACAPLKRCMMDATAAHICTNTLDESACGYAPKYTLDVKKSLPT